MLRRKPVRAAGFDLCAAACGLALAAALPAGAQEPAGGEFQVNTNTVGTQAEPSVAVAPDGDFVVVWEGVDSPGTDTDLSIQGQRYASDGSVQGGQFQVNTVTANGQYSPAVAVAPDGDFVVVWQSYNSSAGTDTNGYSVQGQRYASDGSVQGGQFQVNTYTTNSQTYPAVAAASDGDFVVVWQSSGSLGGDTSSDSIQGRRYASDGSAQGAQFQVNTFTTNPQRRPDVAPDPDGDFVVVWDSFGSPETDTGLGVHARRYASDGSAQGAQFQVNTFTTGNQTRASVGADPDGDFVVAWQSAGSSGTDVSSYSVQGQRYASDGSAQGGQFQINTYTTNPQIAADVAVASDGGFVVTWSSYGSYQTDTDGSIQAQRYTSDGSAAGSEFQVNTYATGGQGQPSVAAGPGTDFVVAWASDGSFGTDTSYGSIQGQRYGTAAPAKLPSLSPGGAAAGALLMLLAAGWGLRRRV